MKRGKLFLQKCLQSVFLFRPVVVYFDPHLGTAHYKRWSKLLFSSFCTFLQDFDEKLKKNEAKRVRLTQKCWDLATLSLTNMFVFNNG